MTWRQGPGGLELPSNASRVSLVNARIVVDRRLHAVTSSRADAFSVERDALVVRAVEARTSIPVFKNR
jgi:hypothetical protein